MTYKMLVLRLLIAILERLFWKEAVINQKGLDREHQVLLSKAKKHLAIVEEYENKLGEI